MLPILLSAVTVLSAAAAQVTYQNNSGTILRVDTGRYGPELEKYHYYYDQWPIGLAISSTSRFFASYTRGNYSFTLGEAVNETAEIPYPSTSLNLPVSQLNTTLYITPENPRRPETLWLVDTGRPTIMDSQGAPTMPYAQPGGPKIIGINLASNSVYATYIFPVSVHFPDSYMNDIRFDLRPSITASGQGVAYIVDSSDEGRPGFIMLDLGTGESWRRLTQHPSTLRVDRDVPSYQGRPFYQRTMGIPVQTLREGLDGLQITPDGSRMYYSPLTSDCLYSIPTANLLARTTSDPLAEIKAANNVTNHGQRGGNANGFEGDSNGLIYQLMPEHNAVYAYNPHTLQTEPLVRDPRIIWPDGASIGQDGYMYLNINQLPYQPMWNDGSDLRMYPGAVVRCRLPGGGGKIVGLA
ncbi:hypothetical protein CC86DRAFT_472836 [Ophiobolus disseminans]|uniref:Major royal jelly protein n=1 Tax=Ophiobolus disseminans TaxID=1469910 RepID=A0A6A6ZC71_9PLEO|nr:hypothetical protein CC86DRAFT_472836 [Ophiobolus disseminans]